MSNICSIYDQCKRGTDPFWGYLVITRRSTALRLYDCIPVLLPPVDELITPAAPLIRMGRGSCPHCRLFFCL